VTIVSDVPSEDGGPRRFPQGRFRAPAGACELLLVRHGQSEDAVEGQEFERLEGHADPPLSALGREQAQRLAARLVTEHIDAVYVTSLRRTAETAAPLAAATGHEPVVEHDLREIYLGDWEGWVFEQKFVDRDPLALRLIEEQRWDLIPGCEPVDGFAARVRAGVGRIAAAHPDQRVLVVVHGGVIGEVLAQASGSRPWAFIGADNASISHVVVTDRRWVVRRFNDTTHLDDRLTVQAAPLI
jgi:2,3-bisphosphoglycerate-dependent phosphoglycerate mutase